jgi:hypothetical protein
MLMKPWVRGLLGILGVVLILHTVALIYFSIEAWPVTNDLVHGTPLYLEFAGRQYFVNLWIMLCALVICPLAFGAVGSLLLIAAVRGYFHKNK